MVNYNHKTHIPFRRRIRPHLVLVLILSCAAAAGTGRGTRAQLDAVAAVSIAPDGSPADAPARNPSISDDGRFVVFESAASNLQPGDTNRMADVFLHDRQSGETRIVSVSPGGLQGDGPSGNPVISGNGRMIVFESGAENLVEGDTNGVQDIFVFDRLTGLIRRVSLGWNGGQANGPSRRPEVDYTGRYLVFESDADNLILAEAGPRGIYVYDLVTGSLFRVGSGRAPVISGDGRIVAFDGESGEGVVYHRVLGVSERRAGLSFQQLSFTGRNLAYLAQDVLMVVDRDRGDVFELAVGGAVTGLRLSADASAVLYLITGSDNSVLYLSREGGPGLPLVLGAIEPELDLSADGRTAVFTAAGLPDGDAHSQIYVYAEGALAAAYDLAGRVTDSRGRPLGLVTIHDGRGGSTRTDADGYFYLSSYPAGSLTLTPEKEGYAFDPAAWNLSVFRDTAGYLFTASPAEKLLEEARLDLGMPYRFDRGCESPHEGCGLPFHGFAAGFCTDLILDAYTFGLEYDINYALEQDAYAHPDHFYRWRDARNTHDMWRYFHFSGQMLPPDEAYLPGDIVFFDWSGDGEIDHVALVSEVESGRPVKLLDATGVTEQNPSGLAAELDWLPFHTSTARGHARWNGLYEPVSSGYPPAARMLQTALSGGGLFMRLIDSQGRAMSFGEATLPAGSYHDLTWEEVISQPDPRGAYTVEIRSVSGNSAPFLFTVQTLSGGLITGRQEVTGSVGAGEVVRLTWTVAADAAGELSLHAEGGGRRARTSGQLAKDR